MIPYLRKEKILGYMEERDVVYINEMAEAFGFSASTIRRDLMTLDQEGEITLLRGGAAKLNRGEYDEPVNRKKLVNYELKQKIAQKAAALVEDGDVIYIDSGTTPMAMFKYLKGRRVIVATSGLPNLEDFSGQGMTCIFLGGELLPELESMVGSVTEKLLSDMNFDKVFLGVNAYSTEGGVCTFDMREARKKEIAASRAKKVYVLADSSKANKKAFCKVFDLDACTLITEKEE